MKNSLFLLLLALSFSCKENRKKIKIFTFKDLYTRDSNRIIVNKADDDSLIYVSDKVIDTLPCGLYTFNEDETFYSYKFLTSNNTYRYSEEYSINGNFSKVIGFPLVNHLYRKNRDSVVFTFNFFSLNKRYDTINITTNMNNKVNSQMGISKIYTNMKCISFTLPIINFNDLIIYTKVDFIDTFFNKKQSFTDTVSFGDIRL